MGLNKILNLNNEFYQTIAEEFSLSRQKPWRGWDRVAELIDKEYLKDEFIDVLDIGSGNGRFYDFLKKTKFTDLSVNYTGIDINEEFLEEAKLKFKEAKFYKKDIFLQINKVKKKFDVVVGFGITHHVPKGRFGTKWFKKLPHLLKKDGLLILTFWEFTDKPGSYLLGWGDNSKVARFCRKFSAKELKKIESTYKKMHLELIDEFNSDRNNKYLVFRKVR